MPCSPLCPSMPRKEINHAAKMAFVVVVRNAVTQVAVQRQTIELVLQIVAVRPHRLFHRLSGIGLAVRSQPVRFIIQQVISAVMAKTRSIKPLTSREPGGSRGRAIHGERIVAANQRIQTQRFQRAFDRQIEGHFDLLIIRGKLVQRDPGPGNGVRSTSSSHCVSTGVHCSPKPPDCSFSAIQSAGTGWVKSRSSNRLCRNVPGDAPRGN